MKELLLKTEDLRSVFNLLKNEYEIYGPKLSRGEGRLSDTDLLDYAPLEDFDELCWEGKSVFSPKELFLPFTEELMVFDGEVVTPSPPAAHPRALFLRPCDTHALKRMDAHFLKGVVDTNYERRRAETLLFVMECTDYGESCFCKTMGTDRAAEYDLLIRNLEDGRYCILMENEKIENLFSPFDKFKYERDDDSHSRDDTVNEPLEIDETVNSFQVWREYARRCTGCGACNFVCPTCFCFTMRDEVAEGGKVVRQRVWSSCQVEGFARVAGGHEYRENQGDKGRFKFMHKFLHFKTVHGMNLCVGCGRCVEACPEYIDIRATMAKVDIESKLARMREEDEPLYTKSGPDNRDKGRGA